MLFPSLLLLALQSDPSPTPPPEKKVLVTAPRHETDPLDVPSSVTVITREDIENSNAHGIVDVLRAQPGLTLQKFSSTPQDSGVEARGFLNGGGAGSRTVVLVDGRRVNGITTGTTDWAAIPLDDIERIEIIRGPGTAMYGDGALGSVISITTRRAGPKPRHDVTLDAGSFRSYGEAASFSASDGPLGAAIHAAHRSSSGFRENSAYDGHDASGLMTYDVGIGKAWLKLSAHDDVRERPGSLTKADIDQFGRKGSVTLGDASSLRTQSAQVGADLDIGGGILSPMASFTRDRTEGVITNPGSSVFITDDESSRLALGLKFVRVVGGITIVAGVDGTIDSAQADSGVASAGFNSKQDQEHDRTIWGPYARVEWKAAPELIVSGSLRHDRADTDFKIIYEDDFTPRSTTEGSRAHQRTSGQVGATYHLRPETTVYAGWGNAPRFPNRDELTAFTITPGLDLRPEVASTFEVGLRSSESPMLRGSLAAYLMDVKDEIFFMPPDYGTPGFGGNTNVPGTRHRGVELELESEAAACVTAFGNVTLQETVVTNGPHDGKDFPLTPDMAAALGVRTNPCDGATLQATWRYVGERWLTNDIENGSDRLPAYGVLDVRAAMKHRSLTIFGEVNNATDRRYFDSAGLKTSFSNPFPAGSAGFYPASGRNYVIGGSLEF